MRLFLLQLFLSICLCLNIVFAQNNGVLDSIRSYHTKPVELVAATSENQLNGLSLNAKKLNQLVMFSAADALKFIPGVNLRDYGGLGGLKTVDFRGFGANHSRVFINGIPQSQGQSGQIDLGLYPIQNINGVQLSQGIGNNAQPLFASEFLETVSINLSTASPDSTLKVYIGSGSFGFNQYGGQIPFRIKNQKLSTQFQVLHSLGNYPFKQENGANTIENLRGNSYLRQYNFQLMGFGPLGKGWDFNWNLWANQSFRGLPGATILYNSFSTDHIENKDFVGQAEVKKTFQRLPIQLKWAARTSFGTLIYEGSNWSGNFTDRYTMPEVWTGLGLSGFLPFQVNWRASLEFQRNQLFSSIYGMGQPQRTQANGVIEVKKPLLGFLLSGYGGFQSFSDIDSRRNYELKQSSIPVGGLSIKFQKRAWNFEASYRKTVRLPTFNDLYFVRVGNLNLVPEQAHQFRIEGQYQKQVNERFSIKLKPNFWLGQATNKIIALPAANVFAWSMQNVGKVFLQGFETALELEWQISSSQNLNWMACLTKQIAVNRSIAQAHLYNHQLAYLAPYQGNSVLCYASGNWQASVNHQFLGQRFLPGINDLSNSLPSVWLTDFSLKRKLKIRKTFGSISLEIMNIFNRQYEIIKSFPMPGAQGRLNLVWNVKA